MRYRVHPSPTLVTTFSNRPFQGQDPNEAKVFFFGIDANYAANVEDNAEFFNILLAYHGNGVAYWQNNENNDHHPFLLPMYREGAGYSYHKTIKGIDLPAETCATAISFVEMLNVPTTGSLNEDPGHVFDHLFTGSHGHLQEIYNAIFDTDNKLVFMPDTVIRKLATTDLFSELDFDCTIPAAMLPVIYQDPDRNIRIYKALHPSVRFQRQREQLLAQLPIIRQLILNFMNQL
jgi:hypothetical protein